MHLKNFEHDFFEADLFALSNTFIPIQNESQRIKREKSTKTTKKEKPIYFNKTEQTIYENLATQISQNFEREHRKKFDLAFPQVGPNANMDFRQLKIDSEIMDKGYFQKADDHTFQLRPNSLAKTNKVRETDKYLKSKSVLVDIEKKFMAPTNQKVKDKKKDKLVKWGGMEAPKMTPELMEELEAMRLRDTAVGLNKGVNTQEAMPKYFQIGTVMEGAQEFFHRRKRKDRKQGFLNELIHDQKQTDYINERYKKIKKY